MSWNAKNGTVLVGNTEMDYVSFGSGSKALILLPGLSDGLATVKGKALCWLHHISCFQRLHGVHVQQKKRFAGQLFHQKNG